MKVCVRGTSGVKGVTYLCAVARHGDKQKHDSGPNESNIRKSGSEALPEIHIAQSAALRAGPEQAVESAEARSTNALNRSGELVHQYDRRSCFIGTYRAINPGPLAWAMLHGTVRA